MHADPAAKSERSAHRHGDVVFEAGPQLIERAPSA
jgi:hypothetical protein